MIKAVKQVLGVVLVGLAAEAAKEASLVVAASQVVVVVEANQVEVGRKGASKKVRSSIQTITMSPRA